MTQQAEAVTTGKRILLVEDERSVRETLRKLLAQDAHMVIEANNGAEAFALFLSTKFDLVLTDFEMPFVKGDELAAKIKRKSPEQPILMLTAYGRKPSLANPVDAVVNKPFDSEELRQTMSMLLSRSEETGETTVQLRQPDTELIPVGTESKGKTFCA